MTIKEELFQRNSYFTYETGFAECNAICNFFATNCEEVQSAQIYRLQRTIDDVTPQMYVIWKHSNDTFS
jgi:hypothetical protein